MIRLVTKHLTQIFIPFHSLLLKNTYEYKNHRKDIFKSKHVNIKIDKQKDKFQPNNLFHIFKYRKRAIEDFT